MSVRTTITGLTLAAGLALAAPAGATVVDHTHFSGSQPPTAEDDFCGITVLHGYEYHGVATIRAGKGDLAGAFFGGSVSTYTDTFTDPDTGRTVTISGHSNVRDVKATHLSGSIFQFVTIEAGAPFTMTADDGTVLFRDRGAIRQTYTFDTGGDDVPGGTYLDPVDLRVSGPHPGFDATDDEFCAAALGALS